MIDLDQEQHMVKIKVEETFKSRILPIKAIKGERLKIFTLNKTFKNYQWFLHKLKQVAYLKIFLLKISSVNMTKSAVFCGFGYIY